MLATPPLARPVAPCRAVGVTRTHRRVAQAQPARRPTALPPARPTPSRHPLHPAASAAAPARPAPLEAGADPLAGLRVPGAPGVTALRGTCARTTRVEVEYSRRRGTTDNTYLVTSATVADATTASPGDAILVDVPDAQYAASFVAALRRAAPRAALPRAVVITHLTPRRLPALRELLVARAAGAGGDAAPLDVYLSTLALRVLRENVGPRQGDAALLAGVTLHAVKPGTRVTLACGRSLALVPAPTPRWPDLIVAFDATSSTFFSSKLFSAHVAPGDGDPVADAAVGGDGVGGDSRWFFDTTLAPVARSASTLLSRLDLRPTAAGNGASPAESAASAASAAFGWLRALDAKLSAAQRATFPTASSTAAASPTGPLAIARLCPLHGPVVDGASAATLTQSYRDWTAEAAEAADALSVAVLYASAYGNTASLGQAIARGAAAAGVGVEIVNLEVAPSAEVEATVSRASAFALGSPTLAGHLPTQVVTALGSIIRSPRRGLPVGVFGSYGWSGEAVADLSTRLDDAGFKAAFTPLRVQFTPTADDMAAAEAAGSALAAAAKARAARKAAVVASGGAAATAATAAQAAVDRVVGSLCVVTTAAPDAAATAMLASWISQASFDPPGLTLAVARGRAAEARLTSPGSRFAVNIVADGADGAVSRALAKAGGGDRLAGLGATRDEDTGALLLGDTVAAAWLDCTVVSTMDAGDHVVVYASVDGGRVAPGGVDSAVRLRKSGATY